MLGEMSVMLSGCEELLPSMDGRARDSLRKSMMGVDVDSEAKAAGLRSSLEVLDSPGGSLVDRR